MSHYTYRYARRTVLTKGEIEGRSCRRVVMSAAGHSAGHGSSGCLERERQREDGDEGAGREEGHGVTMYAL